MAVTTHSVQVDWNGAGGFDAAGVYSDNGYLARGLGLVPTLAPDPGEDVTARVLLGTTAERGRNQIKSLSPPVASDFRFTLNNASGDYSPSNTASPLYPNVDVGVDARWRITVGATTYPVVRGYVDLLDPHPDWRRQTVDMGALGILSRLVDKRGFTSSLYGDGTAAGGIRTDQALGVIFDLAGIPAGRRSFDVGQTSLLWFWIAPGDELFDIALKIWASEGPGARLYDGADGIVYFKSRIAQAVEARSTAVQATYRDTATEPWYAEWEPDSGESSIVNVCTIDTIQRTVDAVDSVIWTSTVTPIVLDPGETYEYLVQSESGDPIADYAPQVFGVDYTVSVGAITALGVSPRGSGATITGFLTAAGTGATVTLLQQRGKLLRRTGAQTVENTVDASASIARYGQKPYQLATLPDIDPLVAQDLTNAVVGQNQAPRPQRTLHIPLASDGLAAGALAREVADRVRVINARELFDREMYVEYVRVEAPQGGCPVAFLGCEAAVDTVLAVWDGATWDESLWAY